MQRLIPKTIRNYIDRHPVDALPESDSLRPMRAVIDNLRAAYPTETRPLTRDELASIGLGEMPSVSHGYIPSQRRVQTAIAALKGLRGEELQIVLQSLAQIKGPVWGAIQLRNAADKIEVMK